MIPTEVDWVRVRLLVDNFFDVFEPSTEGVQRVTPGQTKKPLLAAHGFSLFVEAGIKDGSSHNLLVDTSHSPMVLLHNMEALGIDPDSIEALFLTHGHVDHFGGLTGLLEKRKRPLVVYTHPDAFLTRSVVTPRGKAGPWRFNRNEAEQKGAHFDLEVTPRVVNDLFLLSGEVLRTTEFERPWPAARVERDGREETDHFLDEQALILKVRGKGLVVIAGCSHPGIINMLKHAVDLAATPIHTVIGGFHLGTVDDETREKTIAALDEMVSDLVMPCHCTSFRATKEIADRLSEKFAVNCVGTLVKIGEA